MTKKSISEIFAHKQISKHKAYNDILKKWFTNNYEYFITIWSHISDDDIKEFKNISWDVVIKVKFFDTKLKQYFWKWFDIHTQTHEEHVFHMIGNLWLEDVTNIVQLLLIEWWDSLENALLKIENEIDLRLKNNVLIDAILHLDDFPHTIISQDKKQSADALFRILESNFDKDTNRFSELLVPEVFRQPMTFDGMIDSGWFVPQITFRCPIINLKWGAIFKTFLREFIINFFG